MSHTLKYPICFLFLLLLMILTRISNAQPLSDSTSKKQIAVGDTAQKAPLVHKSATPDSTSWWQQAEKPLSVISLIVVIVGGLAALVATIFGHQGRRVKALAKAKKEGELEAEEEAKKKSAGISLGEGSLRDPPSKTQPLPISLEHVVPSPYADTSRVIKPGGAIEVDSRFYIERDADEIVLGEVYQPRAMIRVHGPRQTGKTSLIMRVYADTQRVKNKLRAAFVDFQGLPQEDRFSLNAIWHAIARYTAEQLQLARVAWNSEESYDQNFSRFVERQVFLNNPTPLLLCLDEADRLFGSPIKSDFFASLRAYYNRGALYGVWKSVRWLLAVSSEPHFFIEELNQSPFDVGMRVDLSRFTPQEVLRCAHALEMKLEEHELEQIMEYVGGHPYLAHLTFYHMARNTVPRAELFNAKTAGGGIYRDHLHRFLIRFQAENDLAEAMKEILHGKACDDAKIEDRLKAAGLVWRDDDNKAVPFCRLYLDFFRSELK